ncbi:nucleotidyltransferase family protein [uncultured Erythrobacter sp.]|uniref:nucleotidyltransferase family protein n=1 Tax=uncultured Erythrobacter sp. TaxID=263913 RepID=UPI002602FB38|nr:nucleotidyltransferase family protein [uncultured Erythrobacter sp.]
MTEFRIGVALLAAGASRRFGEADKLAAQFRGRPLGEHAASALPQEKFARGWVITSVAGHPCEDHWRGCGLQPVVNPDAVKGMGSSVALAASLAQEAGLDALLVALADMPLVPREHYCALLGALKRPCDIAASSNGDRNLPPAIFGSDFFTALMELSGDQGARKLIGESRSLDCPPDWLIDIDSPQDLQDHGQAKSAQPKPPSKGDST